MQFEPAAWAARIEATLVAGLGLVEEPSRLSPVTGTHKGATVTLSARVYRGEAIAYARFVSLVGAADLEIANVLCVARPQRALPILGVDMVKLGRVRPPLLVADAWPTVGAVHLPSPSEAPSPGGSWWQRFSSRDAIVMRVPPEETALAQDRLATLLEGWKRQAQEALDAPLGVAESVRARSNAYLEAHREEDQTLSLLAKIFGEDFARRFIAEVMFPPLAEPMP